VKASVLVPTCGRPGPLARCLEAVLREAPGCEVLTVHAPGDEESVAMVRERFPGVTAVEAEERNLAAQRNLGARRAAGDVVVYLDDDAWPCPGWLAALLAPFRDGATAVGGRVLSEDGSPQVETMAVSRFGRQVALRGGRACPPGLALTLAGGNFAVRRDALLASGGFDENYRYHFDDTDFQWRLQEAGGTLAYAPEAAVYHELAAGPHRRSAYDRDWTTIVSNSVYFAFRHVRRARFRLWFVPVLLQAPKTARALLWFLRGRLGAAGLGRFLSGQGRGLLAGYRKGRTASPRLPFRGGVA